MSLFTPYLTFLIYMLINVYTWITFWIKSVNHLKLLCLDIVFIIECDSSAILNAILNISELRLCVLTATPFENRWWRFTANHRTGFTDEMRMINRMRLIAQRYSQVSLKFLGNLSLLIFLCCAKQQQKSASPVYWPVCVEAICPPRCLCCLAL